MTVQQCSPSFCIPPPASEDGLLTEKGAALAQLLQRQKMMFDLQVQELVRLVAVQQELTGSHPLKEELVSLILGEKAGSERKGEALSTSAVKELLSVFALKDTLTKAEVRLISAANGITPAQVKEFFTSQRKCVRRLLLQRPKLEGDAEQSLLQMEGDGSNGPRIKSSGEMDPQLVAIVDKESGGLAGENAAQMMVQLMETEEGMAGRATLAKVLLRTKQRSCLTRLVELNCVKIIGSWLLQALKEEQTSLLRSLLKVLEKLPAQKCPTVQLLTVTKNVTRLGSYFVQDIGAMAKFLISRWKKMSLLEKVVVEEKSGPEKKNTGGSTVWGKGTLQTAVKKQTAGETGIAARKAAGVPELTGLKKSPTIDAMNLTKAGALSQKRAPDLTGVMAKSTAAQQAEPPNKKLKTGGISASSGARSTSGFEKLLVSNGLLQNSRQGKAAFELLQKSGMTATTGQIDGLKKRASVVDQPKANRKVQVIEKEDGGVPRSVAAVERGDEKSGKLATTGQAHAYRSTSGDDIKKANARKRSMNGENGGQIPSLGKRVDGVRGKEKHVKESVGKRSKGAGPSGGGVLPGVSQFHGYTSALGPNSSKLDRSKWTQGGRAGVGGGPGSEDGRKKTSAAAKGVVAGDSPERPTTPLRIFDWDDEAWKTGAVGTIERPGTPLRLRPDENTWCILPAKPSSETSMGGKPAVSACPVTKPTDDGGAAINPEAEGRLLATPATDGSAGAAKSASNGGTALKSVTASYPGPPVSGPLPPTPTAVDPVQKGGPSKEDDEPIIRDSTPVKPPAAAAHPHEDRPSIVRNAQPAEGSEARVMQRSGEGTGGVDSSILRGQDGSVPVPVVSTDTIAAAPSQALPIRDKLAPVTETLLHSSDQTVPDVSAVLHVPTVPVHPIDAHPGVSIAPDAPASIHAPEPQAQSEPSDKAVQGAQSVDRECKADDAMEEAMEMPPPLRLSQEEMAAAIEAMEREKVPWRTPEAFRLSDLWFVAYGEESKEVAVQNERLRREEEFFGGTNMVDLPDVAQEPWDQEPDYDESLTPLIPSELELSASEPVADPAALQDDAESVPVEVSGVTSETGKPEEEEAAVPVAPSEPEPLAAVGQMGTEHVPAANRLPEQPSTIATSEAPPNVSPGLADAVAGGRKLESATAGDGSGLETLLGQHGVSGQDAPLLAMLLQNPDLVAQLTSSKGFAASGPEANLAIQSLLGGSSWKDGGGGTGQVEGLTASTGPVQEAAAASPSLQKSAAPMGDTGTGIMAILSDAIRTAVQQSGNESQTHSSRSGAMGHGKENHMQQSASGAKAWHHQLSSSQIAALSTTHNGRSGHSLPAEPASQGQQASSSAMSVALPSGEIGPATLEQTLVDQIQQVLPGLCSVPVSSESDNTLRQQPSLGVLPRESHAMVLALEKELAALASSMPLAGAGVNSAQLTGTMQCPSALPPLLQQPSANSSADASTPVPQGGAIGRPPPPPPPPRTSMPLPGSQPQQARTPPPLPPALPTSNFQGLPLSQAPLQGGPTASASTASLTNMQNLPGGPPGFTAPVISAPFAGQGPQQTGDMKTLASPDAPGKGTVGTLPHAPSQGDHNIASSVLTAPVLPILGLQGASPRLGPLLPTPTPSSSSSFNQPRVMLGRPQLPTQDPASRHEQLRQPQLPQDQKPSHQGQGGGGSQSGGLLVVGQQKLGGASEQQLHSAQVHGSPAPVTGDMAPQRTIPPLAGKEPPLEHHPAGPAPLKQPPPSEGLVSQRHVHGQLPIIPPIGQPEAPQVPNQQRGPFSRDDRFQTPLAQDQRKPLSLQQNITPLPLHPTPSQSQQPLPPNHAEHRVSQPLPMSDQHWPGGNQHVWRPSMPPQMGPGGPLPTQHMQLREDQQQHASSPAHDPTAPVGGQTQQSAPSVVQPQVQQLVRDHRHLLQPHTDLQRNVPPQEQVMHSSIHSLGPPPVPQGMMIRKGPDAQQPGGLRPPMARCEEGMPLVMQQPPPLVSHAPQGGIQHATSPVGPRLPPGPPPPGSQIMIGGKGPEVQPPPGIGMPIARGGEKAMTHGRQPPPPPHVSHSQLPQWSGPSLPVHIPHSLRPEVQGMSSSAPLGSPHSADLPPQMGRVETVGRAPQPFHGHLYPPGPNNQPVVKSPIGPGPGPGPSPGPGSGSGMQENGGPQKWGEAPRMTHLMQGRWEPHHPSGGGGYHQRDTTGIHPHSGGGPGEGWGGGDRVNPPPGRGPGDGGEGFISEFHPRMLQPGAAQGHVQFMGSGVYGGGGFLPDVGRPWGPDMQQNAGFQGGGGGEGFRPPLQRPPPFSPQPPQNSGLW